MLVAAVAPRILRPLVSSTLSRRVVLPVRLPCAAGKAFGEMDMLGVVDVRFTTQEPGEQGSAADTSISIGLTLQVPLPPPVGTKLLQRPSGEPLGRALGRLKATIAKAVKPSGNSRKNSGKKNEANVKTSQDCHSPYDELASADQSEYSATTTATTVTGGLNDVAAALSGNVLLSLVDAATGEPVDEACTNLEAWRAGCLLLVDGIGRYRVRVNAPYVASVAAAGHPMVGYPLVGCATGMQHCTDDDLQWRWYRASIGAGAGAEAASESGESCTAHGLDLVGEGRAYTPTCHDLGCVLTVEATALPPPRDNGQDDVQCCPPAAARMSRTVVTAPPRLAARARAAALDFDPSSTASSSPYCVPIVYPSSSRSSRLRVMTYNVLADAYSHTWGAMYPYLTPEMADPERRLLLAMEDVCLVAPDVVALQEVDRKWYHAFWVPQMAAAGYAPVGTLTEKTGLTREGCAMFCRSDRWKVARVKSVGLKEAGPMPGEETTAAWVRTQPHLCHALSKISTVAQLAVLEPLEGKEVALVVANTHLFFHPGAVHLRCLQARWLLRHADEMRQQYREELSRSEGKVSKAAIGLVICGDFNGEPSDGVIRFITRGQLGAGDSDWALGSVFRWGGTSSRAAAAELIALSPGEGELCDGREIQVTAHEGSNASTQMQDLDSRHQRLGRMAASWRAAANVEQGARAACGVVQPSGSPLAIAQAHARAGCTFKTCTAVAVYTLRRDAGMSPSTTLPGLSRVSYPGLDTNGDEGNIGNEVEETGGGSAAADVVATRGAGIATVREVETAKAAELTAAESAELMEVAAAVRWEMAAHRSSMQALCDEAEAEEALTLVDIDGGRGVNEGGGASVDDGGLSLASDRQLCVQQPISGSRSAVDGGANNESERWAARAVGPCAMNLRHPLTLVSACGFPEWTNFVDGFAGALDYIFADAEGGGTDIGGGLRPVAFMPLPPLDAVTAEVALPSSEFPSDHLPMVADFEWTSADAVKT